MPAYILRAVFNMAAETSSGYSSLSSSLDVFFRPPSIEDLDALYAIESASYPPDEAATREKRKTTWVLCVHGAHPCALSAHAATLLKGIVITMCSRLPHPERQQCFHGSSAACCRQLQQR